MELTQNILVSTDFSRASELALGAAAIVAQQNDAKVTLCYVHEATTEPSSDEAEALHARLAALAKAHLSGVPRVKHAVVTSRSAVDGICHYAEKEGVDLIIIATHGRSGLEHVLIGSVAERVVRHAPCPVMTLRSRTRR